MILRGPSRRFDSQQSIRSGYTLIEIMLVLAIMAAVAAISWPALMRPWSRSQAQEAAHTLATHLLETRMRAIEQSRVYEFRWRPGTGEFEIRAPHQGRVLPERSATPNMRGSTSANFPEEGPAGISPLTPNLPAQARPAEHVHEQLAYDVKFESPKLLLTLTPEEFRTDEASSMLDEETALDDETPQQDQESADRDTSDSQEPTAERNSAAWNGNVWFYPDGSTSNGRWRLVTTDVHEVEIYLRGLTGTVKVGPVRPIVFDLEAQEADATDSIDSNPPLLPNGAEGAPPFSSPPGSSPLGTG